MKIQDILVDQPKNRLFRLYKSPFICSVVTVEEILIKHQDDNKEYEIWENKEGFHITKVGDHEVTYANIHKNEHWFHENPPDGTTYYGIGQYFPQ